jgi:hypothetical protein
MNIQIFLDVRHCGLVLIYLDCFTLKMEFVRSFESSVVVYQPTHGVKSGETDFYFNLASVILTSYLQYVSSAKQFLGKKQTNNFLKRKLFVWLRIFFSVVK